MFLFLLDKQHAHSMNFSRLVSVIFQKYYGRKGRQVQCSGNYGRGESKARTALRILCARIRISSLFVNTLAVSLFGRAQLIFDPSNDFVCVI